MAVLLASIYGAAYEGNLGEVKRAVEMGADVNAYNEDGYTPLIMALKGWIHGSEAPIKAKPWKYVVEYLLRHGADPNIRSGDADSLCPINLATTADYEAVKLLLKYGADPNCKDAEGRTPLHYALYFGDLPITKLLIEAGGNPNARDKKGRTPLHYGAYKCSWNVLKYLNGMEGVDWGAVDEYGLTVAMYSTDGCNAEQMLLLAVWGNNLNHRTNKGFNLLHFAIVYAEEKEVVRMIEYMSDFNADGISDFFGATIPPCNMGALHLAAISNRPRVFLKLLEVGLKDYPVDLHACVNDAPEGRFYAHQILEEQSSKLYFGHLIRVIIF